MATYTDNYQLTKPTYAEQADIGVINSNMNIIDDIMHSSQVSLAPAYDQSQTYAEGDVVMYELLMYKCISPTTGVWDASKWERTTASESGGGGSAELDILGEGNGAVVSFSDGASAGLAKCIAEIVPKQAGSGTPSPDNVRTISGSTSVTVTVSDGETSTTKTTALGQTVYGGQLNVLTGLLTITNGYIASYNGETLPSTWISDRDEYAPNTSPTTGAQVVYPLATPQTVQLTPQEVNSLLGQNNISADTGDIDIVYVKASAPIQPNPTGTPTATLKKLGIEGTVFEVEGGGGGSSAINYSTTEQRTGQKWIDGKDIYCKCYQTTISSADNTYVDNTLNNSTIQILPMSSIAIDTKGIYNSTYVFNIYNGCILRIFSNNTGIGVNCENYNTNFGTSTVYVVLYYTKLTD